MHRVILLIGGNEGDRFLNISKAKNLIGKSIGCILQQSGNYESEPWGFEHQQNFINQVIEVNSTLSPNEILKEGQEIEKELGRKPKTKIGYEGRTMDIDILFYNEEIVNQEDLIIPHPKLHERKFTLLPLIERWADFKHPIFKKSLKQLGKECEDEGWVRLVESL
ncbi:2-amino-4-hydroxy-6-hydroxymethyldihydropteridine diphosphokinase [Labilibacter marinus]|uniref:2-amino-4-hydroxy-6- hydroxymethyldihydropteridine diphosphokinase n=1 Tax=Labilibacter marinus TaxID=1477105 RepID=UPI00082B4DE2|nr:2-amino-4-hydroxy-6-hydroxymethyldihydropteridine diphosphokinase [Labilibacter marinus]